MYTRIGLLIVLLGWIGGASAALTTKTWTAIVDEVGAESLNAIGDTITITATWDDAGTSHNRWNDGSNGIAEFGAGDDTVESNFMLGTPAYSGYKMLSNGSITFSGINISTNPQDIFDTNQSRVTETHGNLLRVYYAADNLLFSLWDTFNQVPQTGFGLLPSHLSVTHGYRVGNQVFRSDFQATVNPVPIPAAAWLFGSALLGLAAVKRKKS